MKILIVDDDELSQRILSIQLANLGHTSVFASTGKEALKVIESNRLDLVFLDLHLPMMNGLEVCRHVREREGQSTHLPIVALTASVEDVNMQDYTKAGIDDYLSKPYKERQISMVLEACQNGLYTISKHEKPGGAGQPDPTTRESLLNVKGALQFFGGDRSEYRALIHEFLDALPERLSQMQTNLLNKQWKDLAIQAHNLKGISSYFGAMQLSALSAQLQELCDHGDHTRVDGTLEQINRNVRKIKMRVRWMGRGRRKATGGEKG